MDLRSVGIERQTDVEQGRLLLEADLDRVDRRLRCLLRLGRDRGDRLALVADLAVGEQRLVARDSEPFEMAVHVPRNVGGGDDRVHALQRLGLRRVELRDRGAMVR